MNPQDSELIKRAEQLEYQSKLALKEKNYDKVVSNLLNAKDIYTTLGLTGQVEILTREIIRIKNLQKQELQTTPSKSLQEFKIELELHPKDSSEKEGEITEEKGYKLLETARSQALKDKIEDALYFYDVAYKLFKKLNQNYECKQILWQINELKEFQRWGDSRRAKGIKPAIKDIVSLAMAERRRLKLQSQLEVTKKPFEKEDITPKEKSIEQERKLPKLFEHMKKSEFDDQKKKEESKILLELQKEQRIQDNYERLEKIRMLREKKKQEDTQLTQAHDLLDKGNKLLKSKNYDEAKNYYLQSIELFSKLGWSSQVTILQTELKNIDRYKKEDEFKQQQILLSKVESERKFQQSLSKALNDKNKIEEIKKERLGTLPLEIKTTLEKIELLKSKAEKELEINNNTRALARYEYILTLYQSISAEIVDLSEDIFIIESKIAELKAKL
jgi:hypothetical protein